MFEKEIEIAVEKFRALMQEQLARQNQMELGSSAKDYTKQEKIIVGVCGGDGIGPILMREAKRLMEVLLHEEIESGKIELREIEGLTIENRLDRKSVV